MRRSTANLRRFADQFSRIGLGDFAGGDAGGEAVCGPDFVSFGSFWFGNTKPLTGPLPDDSTLVTPVVRLTTILSPCSTFWPCVTTTLPVIVSVLAFTSN